MTRSPLAYLPLGLLVVASCDASVRLGSIGSDAPANEVEEAGVRTTPGFDSSIPETSSPDRESADANVTTPSTDADADAPDASHIVTLATDMPGAEWIAVGPNHITWTTSGRAGTSADPNGHFVSAKDGSNRVQLNTEPGIMRGVMIDGPAFDAVRWVSPVITFIERATATTTVRPHVGNVKTEGFGITFDDTYVYVAATTKVARIEKDGDGGFATPLLASFSKAVAIANDGAQLYVADQGIQRVARVDKATGDVPWSHPIGGAINDVTTDATYVYFAGGGRAGRVLKTGSGLEVFDLPGANALAVDSSGIYYATTTAVVRANLATPSVVTTVASGFVSLGRIALDADFIYFTDFAAGAVYRLPKE